MIRGMVLDYAFGDARARAEGEPLAGVSFMFPILTQTVSTTFGATSAREAGMTQYIPAEFNVFSAIWRGIVSQTGGNGTGILQLWNFSDNVEIAQFLIGAAMSFVPHEAAVVLPAQGAPRLIGGRLWRSSGSGTVSVHTHSLLIRER